MTNMQVTYESAGTHENPASDSDGVARIPRQTRRPARGTSRESTNTFAEDLASYSQDSNRIDDHVVRDTNAQKQKRGFCPSGEKFEG